MSVPLTVSSTPPALPITSLSRVLSVNVLLRPALQQALEQLLAGRWSVTWTQLRSVAAHRDGDLAARAPGRPRCRRRPRASAAGGRRARRCAGGAAAGPATSVRRRRRPPENACTTPKATTSDERQRPSPRSSWARGARAGRRSRPRRPRWPAAGRPRCGRVELGQQRRRVEPDVRGDGAEVAAGVEVAAAGREVVVLDAHDEGAADAGGRRDLLEGQSGRLPRLPRGSCRWTPCSLRPP